MYIQTSYEGRIQFVKVLTSGLKMRPNMEIKVSHWTMKFLSQRLQDYKTKLAKLICKYSSVMPISI